MKKEREKTKRFQQDSREGKRNGCELMYTGNADGATGPYGLRTMEMNDALEDVWVAMKRVW